MNFPIKKCIFLLSLIFIFLNVSACDELRSKDNDESSDELQDGNIVQLAKVSVAVSLIDTSGAPLADVNVTVAKQEDQEPIEGVVSSTDSLGGALLSGLPEQTDLVFSFKKSGYATQVKPFTTQSGEVTLDELQVVMLPREDALLFNGADPAELNGKDGAYLAVEGNAFVDSDGNFVGGDIEVHITPLDVSSSLGAQAFPGAFEGILDDGVTEKPIVSFGTTEFVFTQNGEPLDLAPGATAIIDMPIYSKQYPNGDEILIGDEIPLWSLNEITGIWRQEGHGEVIAKPASRTGLAMRAEVTHFTWWNTDWYPADEQQSDISIRVTPVDEQGNELSEYLGKPVAIYSNLLSNAFSSRSVFFSFGETIQGPIFEGVWCIKAGYRFSDVTTSLTTQLYSEEQCGLLKGGEHLEFTIVMSAEFKVENNIRSTATRGGDIAACGEPSRIDSRSLYPVRYQLVSGSLPPGLTLHDNGRITGAPTSRGQFNFQIDVEEVLPDGSRGEWTPIIHDLEVFPEPDLRAFNIQTIFNVAYDYTSNVFTASGGMNPLKPLRLAEDGSVPPGMSLDDLDIEGAPSRVYVNGAVMPAYVTNVKAILEDQNCHEDRDEYEQWVIWAPKLQGVAPLAVMGQPYSFTATNVEGPIDHWEAVAGLPVWAQINRLTGEITGIPARGDVGVESEVIIHANGPEMGSYAGIPQLAGVYGAGAHSFILNVVMNPPELVSDPGLRQVAVGQFFTEQTANIGEVADYWEVDNLPSWAAFDTDTGMLSGMPRATGRYDDIVIRAVNAGGVSEADPFSIEVVLGITAPQLSGVPNLGVVGSPFAFTVSNGGGTVDAWTVNGALPPGLTFAGGTFSGTPTVAGSFVDLEIVAENSAGSSNLFVTLEIDLGEQAALIFDDPGPLQKQTTDAVFTNVARGGSGSGAITYRSSDLEVAAVDAISGEVTLSGAGQTTVTAIKAGDLNYQSVAASYLLEVSEPLQMRGLPTSPLVLTREYEFLLSVPGLNIVDWELLSGDLPNNMGFEFGRLYGIPYQEGAFEIVIRAHDELGSVYDFDVTLEVLVPACPVGGEGFCFMQLILDEEQLFVFDVGQEVVSWELTSGSIPTGMNLDLNTGVLSGIPTVEDTFEFMLTATTPNGTVLVMVSASVWDENNIPS